MDDFFAELHCSGHSVRTKFLELFVAHKLSAILEFLVASSSANLVLRARVNSDDKYARQFFKEL